MIKFVFQVYVVSMLTVSAAYAETTAVNNGPKVINTFSEDYQNDSSKQSTSASQPLTSTSTQKIKYISGFTDNNPDATQVNSQDAPATNSNTQKVATDTGNSQPANSNPSADTSKVESGEPLKLLRSN